METVYAIGNIVVPLLLLVLGYVFGSHREKKHFLSIVEREKHLLHIATVTFDELDIETPTDETTITNCEFVSGSVVVSIDYFKRFVAALRMLFGGQVSSYETLLDRARREAILRMKEAAGNADSIANMRIETSTLSSGRGLGTVEVHAYGTALFSSQTPESTVSSLA